MLRKNCGWLFTRLFISLLRLKSVPVSVDPSHNDPSELVAWCGLIHSLFIVGARSGTAGTLTVRTSDMIFHCKLYHPLPQQPGLLLFWLGLYEWSLHFFDVLSCGSLSLCTRSFVFLCVGLGEGFLPQLVGLWYHVWLQDVSMCDDAPTSSAGRFAWNKSYSCSSCFVVYTKYIYYTFKNDTKTCEYKMDDNNNDGGNNDDNSNNNDDNIVTASTARTITITTPTSATTPPTAYDDNNKRLLRV